MQDVRAVFYGGLNVLRNRRQFSPDDSFGIAKVYAIGSRSRSSDIVALRITLRGLEVMYGGRAHLGRLGVIWEMGPMGDLQL